MYLYVSDAGVFQTKDRGPNLQELSAMKAGDLKIFSHTGIEFIQVTGTDDAKPIEMIDE